jgi:crotonobetainyl-CoA:carnitine CoA-transferase CaiB-like acyl-CoA transferase
MEESDRFHAYCAASCRPPRSISTTSSYEVLDSFAAELQEIGLAALPVAPITEARPLEHSATYRRLRQTGVFGSIGRPLAGLRVVECGHIVAAPYAGYVLATLGAHVLRVSHPNRTTSRLYGKDVLTLDFNEPSELAAFSAICKRSDVAIDNFTNRVWGNFGFDPLSLGSNIHLRLSGFPSTDRRRDWKAYGFQIEALYGVGAQPTAEASHWALAPGIALLDHAAGLAGVVSLLSALMRGRAGRLEIAQSSVAQSFQEIPGALSSVGRAPRAAHIQRGSGRSRFVSSN